MKKKRMPGVKGEAHALLGLPSGYGRVLLVKTVPAHADTGMDGHTDKDYGISEQTEAITPRNRVSAVFAGCEHKGGEIMKLSVIQRLCKAEKHISIIRDEAMKRQWIGTSKALFPVYGLGELDEQTIMTIFDIEEEDREAYNVVIADTEYNPDQYADNTEHDRQIQLPSYAIATSAGNVLPIVTDKGIRFLRESVIKAIKKDGYSGIFARTNRRGEIFFVVTDGLMLSAILSPEDRLINDELNEMLSELSEQMNKAVTLKAAQEREADTL